MSASQGRTDAAGVLLPLAEDVSLLADALRQRI